jgi:hypothetical protein
MAHRLRGAEREHDTGIDTGGERGTAGGILAGAKLGSGGKRMQAQHQQRG